MNDSTLSFGVLLIGGGEGWGGLKDAVEGWGFEG